MLHRYWIPSLIVLAVCATFGRSLSGDFVRLDDSVNVYENPYVAPGELGRVGPFWREGYERLYVPLTYTAWTAIAATAQRDEPRQIARGPLTKLDAWPFHAANLALHIGSALLAFALLRRLVKDDWAACAGALLFALHPAQVEPVAWITGLKDVLSGFLSLAALLLYVRVASASEHRAGVPWKEYGLATLCFLLALLAKPSAVVVPLVAFAIDRWMLRRELRASALLLAPWLVLSLAWVFLTSAVQKVADVSAYVSLGQRPLIAGDALAFYLGKLFWPASLAPDYGRTPALVLASSWSKLAWLVPLALLVAAVLARRRWPGLFVAYLVFLLALLPVAGFVPFNFQHFATVADRYLYLALLGPALALASLASSSRRGVLAASALVVAALGVRSALQARYWHDTVALFEHTLEANPRSAIARSHLADVLADEGHTAEAIAKLEEALRLRPDLAALHHSIGAMMEEQGRIPEAVEHYQAALRTTPNFAPSRVALAKLLLAQGPNAAAIVHLRAAIEERPRDAEAHYVLGNALAQEQDAAGAEAQFALAVEIQPDFAVAHANRGLMQAQLGRMNEAVASLTKALALQPDLAPAHATLGRLLVHSNQPAAAIPHLREALKTFPDDETLTSALAMAEQLTGTPPVQR